MSRTIDSLDARKGKSNHYFKCIRNFPVLPSILDYDSPGYTLWEYLYSSFKSCTLLHLFRFYTIYRKKVEKGLYHREKAIKGDLPIINSNIMDLHQPF